MQSIHNYRHFCTNGFFFRNNHICEECINKKAYHALKYGCYRNSRIQTYSVARMIENHKKKDTWTKKINAFICPTEFVYSKFIKEGFPKEKLFKKPNFVLKNPNPLYKDQNYFLFAGRLDNLKGINILSSLKMKFIDFKLKIIGDGPEIYKLRDNPSLEIVGGKTHAETINYIKNSIAVIYPSIWYENFGMTIIEAFACGKPVIASRLGTMQEIIEEGKTGLLFEPGNADDLKERLSGLLKIEIP